MDAVPLNDHHTAERARSLVERIWSIGLGNVELERLLALHGIGGVRRIAYSEKLIDHLAARVTSEQALEIDRQLDELPNRQQREEQVQAARDARRRRAAAERRMARGEFGWTAEEEAAAHTEELLRESAVRERDQQRRLAGELDELGVEPEMLWEIAERELGWVDIDAVPMSYDRDEYCSLYDNHCWSAVVDGAEQAGVDTDNPAVRAYLSGVVYEIKASNFESGWIGALRLEDERKRREQDQRLARRRRPLTLRHRHRACARGRASRGKASRARGSRRVTSRSAGGGSGDDPDPEPLAQTGPFLLAENRLVLGIAVTGFGMQIGEGFMGLEGKLVGGAVAYLWCCWRWHRRAARMRRG